MVDDICDRLVRFSAHKQCVSTDLEVEAADEITRLRDETDEWEKSHNTLVKEIERLREENARLREALVPFAGVFLFPDDLGFEHSEDIRSDPDWDEDANDMQSEDVFVLRRDIRRARAAIREDGRDE